MMISDGTVQVLKNFSSLNQSVMLRAGDRIRTVTTGKSVLADVVLNDTIPQDGGIYDLGKFLGALSLFEKPELSFSGKTIDISSGKTNVTFVLADESSILQPPDNDVKMPSVDVSFTLTNDDFIALQRGAAMMRLSEMGVIATTGAVTLEARNEKTGDSSDRFALSDLPADVSNEGLFLFKMDNLRMLPMAYRVEISEAGIAKFSAIDAGETCKSVTYYVATTKAKK